MQKYLLAKNDILFARTGGTVGKSYLVGNIPEKAIYAGYLIRLRISDENNPNYVKYFMESESYWKQLRSGTTATAQPNCNGKTLSQMIIPLPPIDEQRRIVSRLDVILPLIAELESAENELEALERKFPCDMREALLQAAIEGKLTGSNTDNWRWVRLGDIGRWQSGATPSKTRPEFYGGNIPWLVTGDLNDDFIGDKDITHRITEIALAETSVKMNPRGSVLIAMYGATIGRTGVLNVDATTNQACCACLPYEGVYNEYLFRVLQALKQTFINMAAGGAQPNISKEKIIRTIVPLAANRGTI